MLLLNPLLRTSAELFSKQVQYEKMHELSSEADRAFELMGRAIRIAAYQPILPTQDSKTTKRGNASKVQYLEVQKGVGYRGSDALFIRHALSGGIDFDCIGNVLTKERTKNNLAYQGFVVNAQTTLPKGAKSNGGSLICQSLDRQGRIQNTTLMNGVHRLLVEELLPQNIKPAGTQRRFRLQLFMTDGAHIHIELERIFASRNL